MKIFYCGYLSAPWMTGWQRVQVLRELGHTVIEFLQDDYYKPSLDKTILKYVTKKYFFKQESILLFNKNFLEAISETKPEVAWIEKSLLLLPETLEQAKRILPNCIFVCFQEDDPFSPLNKSELPVWKNFIDAIPFYDIHFVWREFNVKEFIEHGAKKVSLYMHGFYSKFFHPVSSAHDYKHDVVFVGEARNKRIKDIYNLAVKEKISVNVYGGRWNRTLVYYLKKSLFHPPAFTNEYVSLICNSKISLGFLSAANRDEFTLRSFEIPACQGFFLAERTPKHLELYEEGKEAEFFSSYEECADKIRFYLNHETERKRIAELGYQRCLNSGYSLHDRLSKALQEVRLMKK
jgi:spore maturation protein CgeB